MIVKCIHSNIKQLTNRETIERLNQWKHISKSSNRLIIGEEYYIFAIVQSKNSSLWYYIDTDNDDYPRPYPAEFFEIIDNTIPHGWKVVTEKSDHAVRLFYISFAEWADDPLFHEKLVDDDEKAIMIYQKQLKIAQNTMERPIIKTDQDRKRLEQIKHKLSMFQQGLLSPPQVASEIHLLHDSISHLEPNWNEKFASSFKDFRSYCNQSKITVDENDAFDKTLNDLNLLIDKALKCYIKISNPAIKHTAQSIDNEWLACPNCENAWESKSQDPMVICPHCDTALHNPRYEKI
jgi:hypothetical protein